MADAFGYADETGAIYLTDTPTGDQYTLLEAAPLEAVAPIAGIANAKTLVASSKRINQDNAPYRDVIKSAAEASGVEDKLLHAVITAESNYNPRAVSPKGAKGLMQLMPGTARQYGVSNVFDPAQNIQGGARYLAYLKTLFNNDLSLTVAAYNAGENAVIGHGRKVPPYRETTAYVTKVLDLYKRYY
ncbi:MAG: lytic transglycosylase domain-containing protein [Methylophilaceae bacterium]